MGATPVSFSEDDIQPVTFGEEDITPAKAAAPAFDKQLERVANPSPTEQANRELAKQGLSVQPPPTRFPQPQEVSLGEPVSADLAARSSPQVRSGLIAGGQAKPAPLGSVPVLDAPITGGKQVYGGLRKLGEASDIEAVHQAREEQRKREGKPVTPAFEADPKATREAGFADVMQGTNVALTPAFVGAGVANPIGMGKGLLEATAASKTAGKVAEGLDASEDQKRLAEESAFFAPMAMRMGAGFKSAPIPENALGVTGHTAEAFGGAVKGAYVKTPQGSGAGVKVGGTSFAVGKVNDVAAAMSKARLVEGEAAKTVHGVPPPAPPPPPGPAQITSKHVDTIAQAIRNMPEEQRSDAMLEAHANLSKWILDRGKVLGPDGKLASAKNPEQAESIAQKWINDSVTQADKAAQAREKDLQKSAGARKSPAATAHTRRQTAGPAATLPAPVSVTQPQSALPPQPALSHESDIEAARRGASGESPTETTVNRVPVAQRASTLIPAEANAQMGNRVDARNVAPTYPQQPDIVPPGGQDNPKAITAQPPATPPNPNELAQVGTKDSESGRQVLQPKETVAANQKLAVQAAPELHDALAQIAGSIPGAQFERLRPQKSSDRASEKVEEENKPPETVPDYLAAQVAADTPQAKDQLVAELKRNFNVLEVEDRFLEGRPDKAGYPSTNVQVQLGNGESAEIQIVPREVQNVSLDTHKLYSKGRDAEVRGNNQERDRWWGEAEKINQAKLGEFKARNGIGAGIQAQPAKSSGQPIQFSESDVVESGSAAGTQHPSPADTSPAAGRQPVARTNQAEPQQSGQPQESQPSPPAASSSPANLTKGQRVLLKNGSEGEVGYAHPEMNIVRVTPANGKGKIYAKREELAPIHEFGEEEIGPAARGAEATTEAAKKSGIEPTPAQSEHDIQAQAEQMRMHLDEIAEHDPELAKQIESEHPEVKEILAKARELASNKESHVARGNERALPESSARTESQVREVSPSSGNGRGVPEKPGEDVDALKRRVAELEAKVGGTPPKRDSSSIRKAAESLQPQIEQKRNPAIAQQNVTARRARIADNMSRDADSIERVKKKLEAIADAIDQGSLPESLSGIRTRGHVEALLANRDQMPTPGVHKVAIKDAIAATLHVPGTKEARDILSRTLARSDTYIRLYGDEEINAFESLRKKAAERGVKTAHWNTFGLDEYKRLKSAGIGTQDKFAQARKDLAQLGGDQKPTNNKEAQIKAAERNLIGTKIPGYFPTPKPLAERLVQEADIRPRMSVLEPSAGKGNIADAIKAASPDVKLDIVEPSTQLRDILNLKGHTVVGNDFLEHKGEYDRIVMNPPFENGQDIEHVQRAYDMLKPGGRIVAIMSEGPFFRNDKKAAGFREWLGGLGGISEKLPEGSFTGKDAERQTGVASRLVKIDKPADQELRTVTMLRDILRHKELSAVDKRTLQDAGVELTFTAKQIGKITQAQKEFIEKRISELSAQSQPSPVAAINGRTFEPTEPPQPVETAEPSVIERLDKAVSKTGAEVKKGAPSKEMAARITKATTMAPSNDAELQQKYKGAAYQREYFKSALQQAADKWADVTKNAPVVEFGKRTTHLGKGEITAYLKDTVGVRLAIKEDRDGAWRVEYSGYASGKAQSGPGSLVSITQTLGTLPSLQSAKAFAEQRLQTANLYNHGEPFRHANGTEFNGKPLESGHHPAWPSGMKTAQLYIKVPGDGHFLINNNSSAIAKALKGADEGFSLPSPEGSAAPRVPKPAKEFDNDKYIAQLEKEIKSLEDDQKQAEKDAARWGERPYIAGQLTAARENLAEATGVPERSAQAGFARTEALNPIFYISEAAKRLNSAYDNLVERGIQRAHLGRSFPDIERVDKRFAELVRELKAAPQYFKAKAEAIDKEITGGLSRDQEKGFVLLADKASREWLAENKNSLYQKYYNDPAITDALDKYKKHEEELREAQRALGGAVIEDDYLRRVYEKHVAGVGEGGKVEQSYPKYDRVITPQMANSKGRKASPEYYFDFGLHEFGPSFVSRYVATHLKLAEHNLAANFMSKATKLTGKDELPSFIDYNGERYYSPEAARLIRESKPDSEEGKQIAKELGIDQLPKPSSAKEYGIYSAEQGGKFEGRAKSLAHSVIAGDEQAEGKAQGLLASLGTRYLGPKEVVKVLESNADNAVPSFVRDLSQVMEPITGALRQNILVTGIPHIKNILRSTMLARPTGQLDPRAWVDAWKVAFDKELKARALKGVNDEAFDALLKHAGMSPHGGIEYKHYLNLNFDKDAWRNLFNLIPALRQAYGEPGLKGVAKGTSRVAGELLSLPAHSVNAAMRSTIGTDWHKIMFGDGGLDQKARIQFYDRIHAEDPSISDAEIADQVNDFLGRYARAGWTVLQKVLAPFMLFPGWSFRSITFALRYPIRSVLPAALITALLNYVLNRHGRKKDKYDARRLHVGGRSVSETLLKERMAEDNPLTQLPIDYATSRLRGKTHGEAIGDALSGLSGDAGALIGTANPLVTTLPEVGFNKQYPGSSEDIYKKSDFHKKGVVVPKAAGGKGTEDWLKYAMRKSLPQVENSGAISGKVDPLSFIGRNIGTSNYPEKRKRY